MTRTLWVAYNPRRRRARGPVVKNLPSALAPPNAQHSCSLTTEENVATLAVRGTPQALAIAAWNACQLPGSASRTSASGRTRPH